MPGKLSTHALDLYHGRPAANLEIQLLRCPGQGIRTLLKTVTTNADGRTDGPLLSGDELEVGGYELVFALGLYFRQAALYLPTPAFLDEVPVRFAVAEPTANYHVPLIFSPWAYSTYRGS